MSDPEITKEQRKSIKRQLGNDQQNAGDWPKCLFWIPKNSRYCSCERAPNSLYCVNHYFMDESQSGNKENHKKKRVQCPLDPSHSVYEYKLQKHLKICNKAKSAQVLQYQPYYEENRNLGGDSISEDYLKSHYASILVNKIHIIDSFISRDHISENMVFPEILESYVEERKKENIKHEKLRHIYQQGAIINNMKDQGLLKDGNIYIEMGAGRGMLSLMVEHVSNIGNGENSNKYILVDRGKNRFKCDRYMRHKDSDSFQRINIDIKDLNIEKIPMVENNPDREVVYISKHLCGVATDLALKSLTPRVSGVCIATCCHHRCVWKDYVGKSTFLDLGFIPSDFEILKRVSSWACCGDWGLPKRSKAEEQVPPPRPQNSSDQSSECDSDSEPEESVATCLSDIAQVLDFNAEACRDLGHMCKRIIDYGRKQYINSLKRTSPKSHDQSFVAKLVKYCNKEDSPENRLLIASYE